MLRPGKTLGPGDFRIAPGADAPDHSLSTGAGVGGGDGSVGDRLPVEKSFRTLRSLPFFTHVLTRQWLAPFSGDSRRRKNRHKPTQNRHVSTSFWPKRRPE